MCDKSLSLEAYQQFYAKRVKHLEDFKRTFGNKATFPDDPDLHDAMVDLKSNMVILIEQDVTLMRQLLSIKDAIEELKTDPRTPSPTKSPLSSPTPLRIPIKSRGKGHTVFSSPPSPLSPSKVEIRPRSILISTDSADQDLGPPSPLTRTPHKARVKAQRSLTHDSYDSNSSGFASQASSPTSSSDTPTRPPRSKGQKPKHHGHVELILTEPDEVSV